jgi:hypothetical protein
MPRHDFALRLVAGIVGTAAVTPLAFAAVNGLGSAAKTVTVLQARVVIGGCAGTHAPCDAAVRSIRTIGEAGPPS